VKFVIVSLSFLLHRTHTLQLNQKKKTPFETRKHHHDTLATSSRLSLLSGGFLRRKSPRLCFDAGFEVAETTRCRLVRERFELSIGCECVGTMRPCDVMDVVLPQ